VNSTHSPPLDDFSCVPPVPSSSLLTVGTFDANGAPVKSVSRVTFGVLAGKPSIPGDDADVRLSAFIDDVRLASDLSDYTGQLEARVGLRITDKDNTPNHGGGTGAGTMSDTTFSFMIPCAATADTTIGGECTVATTAEALVPGLVKESRRTIWEVQAAEPFPRGAESVEILDADGNAFMRQGIFIP